MNWKENTDCMYTYLRIWETEKRQILAEKMDKNKAASDAAAAAEIFRGQY